MGSIFEHLSIGNLQRRILPNGQCILLDETMVEAALVMHEFGIAFQVNDGRYVTVVMEDPE